MVRVAFCKLNRLSSCRIMRGASGTLAISNRKSTTMFNVRSTRSEGARWGRGFFGPPLKPGRPELPATRCESPDAGLRARRAQRTNLN